MVGQKHILNLIIFRETDVFKILFLSVYVQKLRWFKFDSFMEKLTVKFIIQPGYNLNSLFIYFFIFLVQVYANLRQNAQ